MYAASHWRGAAARLALAALLLIAGCSAPSLVYRNAPGLFTLWASRALDLPQAHREALRAAAEEVHGWHRGAPRRALVALLREAAARLASPVSLADGEWLASALEAHAVEVGERLAVALSRRLPPVSPEERERIARRMAERRADHAEELARGEPRLARARRIERIEERAEHWLGWLEAGQRELIAGAAATLAFDPGLWLDERERRERELLEALVADDRGERLRSWFVNWRDGRPPAAAGQMTRQRAQTIAMWVALANSASDGQRAQLRERLGGWVGALEAAGD